MLKKYFAFSFVVQSFKRKFPEPPLLWKESPETHLGNKPIPPAGSLAGKRQEGQFEFNNRGGVATKMAINIHFRELLGSELTIPLPFIGIYSDFTPMWIRIYPN